MPRRKHFERIEASHVLCEVVRDGHDGAEGRGGRLVRRLEVACDLTMTTSPIRRLGAHPVAVWAIKHVASPLDRLVVKVFGGRIPQPSSLVLPTLLLTTVGRRSGLERTVPLVFVRDGERYVVANARPSGERRNPWVANLRAAGTARVKHGRRSVDVIAHEIGETGVERWWPALVDVWPAFGEHFAATGERTVFVLEPVDSGANGVVADVPG